jgi:hypothetical protein
MWVTNMSISKIFLLKGKKIVKQSLYRPGVVQRVPGI